MIERIALLTWNRPKAVLGAVALFAVLAVIVGRGVEEHLKAAGFTDDASESERAIVELRDELGYDANPGIVVLVRDPDSARLDLAAEGTRREVERLAVRLRGTRFVGKAIDPLAPLDRIERRIERAQDSELQAAERERRAAVAEAALQTAALGLPPAAPPPSPVPPSERELAEARAEELRKAAGELRRQSPLIADDGRSLVITGHLATQDVEDDGGTAAEDAGERLGSERFEIGIGGFAPSFNEVNDQTRSDLTKAEVIAFPILTVLLLVVFRGVIAALIPLLIGVVSIMGTLMMLRVMSAFVDTSLFALNIATGLSLGLAVDYALLMVSRYREELERAGPVWEAHRRTVMTAGRTVLFSGMTVAVAMAALVVFPQRFLYSVAVAGATVAVLASLIALFAVPAVLALLGDRINSLSVRRGHAVSDESDGWYRLAWWVMRRPVAVALASSALLLAASVPLLSTVLTGPSAEAVPAGQPSYEVNAYVEGHYDRGVTEAITVAVRGRADRARLRGFHERIERIEGIERGSPFDRVSPALAYANFAGRDRALSEGTQDAVREIRATSPPAGTELLVSGNTARFIDQKRSLLEHTPLVVAIVIVTTLFLLFMLTGSVILPIKTLIMNTLTLSASLGILVLGFQEGWFDSVFDYIGPSAVEVTSLVFVFAVTFGLATDYAVLVMARIKEQHDLGAPNEDAVAIGIGRTGRVITAAAVMIAVVFLAFSVSSVFFMKQISVAQAAGVLIDATIVRALLVPSLMRLLGEWNWWAPAPLARFHQRFGFRD
ncbi:MAG: MMPL family transporter [Solirubrobacterales bacterium]